MVQTAFWRVEKTEECGEVGVGRSGAQSKAQWTLTIAVEVWVLVPEVPVKVMV
jgi:hypothetical protein